MKRNLILLYTIVFLQGMVFYGPVAVLYRQAAGITVFQMTLIEGISLVLTVGLEIPWGILAEKIGYRSTMVTCCIVFFISKIIFWQAVDFAGFLTERVLLAVVSAGLSGCDTALLYRSCRGEDTHWVFSLYSGLGLAGLLCSSCLYTLVVGENFRLAGLLTVFSYGLAALASLGLREVGEPEEEKEKKAPEKRSPVKAFRAALWNPRLLLLLVAAALMEQTNWAVTVVLNQLQYQRSGLEVSAMGVILAGVSLVGLLGVFSKKLTGRLGILGAGELLFALTGGSCILLAVTAQPVVSILGIAVVSGAGALFTPLQTELQNRQVKTSQRATELSIQSAFLNGAGALVSVAFGRAAEGSVPGAFLLGAACCVLGGLLYGVWCGKMRYKADNVH